MGRDVDGQIPRSIATTVSSRALPRWKDFTAADGPMHLCGANSLKHAWCDKNDRMVNTNTTMSGSTCTSCINGNAIQLAPPVAPMGIV